MNDPAGFAGEFRATREPGRRLARAWELLIRPAPGLAAPDQRRSARLVSSLLLGVITIGSTSIAAQVALGATAWPVFAVVGGALAILVLAYAVSRTVHYRIAALIAVLVPAAAGSGVGLSSPDDVAWFAFASLGMVIATALLPVRLVAFVSLVTVGLVAAVIVVADPPLPLNRSAAIFGYVGALAVVVILGRRHVELVERDHDRAVRQSTALYRQVFNHVPIGIAVVNAAGHLIEVNDALIALTGGSRSAASEQPDTAQSYADPAVRQAIASRFASEGRIVREEVQLRKVDQTPLTAELSIVSLRLGEELCRLAIVEDIGPRKSMEAQRQLAEEERVYLAEVLDRSLNEVYIFDAETLRFEYANEGARRNLRYTTEQLKEMTPLDLKPEFTYQSFRARIAPLLTGETPLLMMETVHRRVDGSEYPVDVRLQLATRRGRKVVLALILDITERRRLQADLLRSQKIESIGRLAGGVAHDFNNLLTIIRANVELAISDLGPESPSGAELAAALQAADSAAGVTRQLLAFSRRQVIRPKPLNVNALIEDLEPMLRRLISEDIVLDIAPAPDIGLVRADANQLEQVLINLAVNARDAMPEGGRLGIVTGSAADGGRLGGPPGECVFVTVTDSGAGMSEEVRTHIFEPFFTTKEARGGTGLGLASAEGVVSQHGGTIVVTSEPGRGSAFTIYLPRIADMEERAAPASPAPPPRGTETVLVVEDDEQLRRVTAQLLQRLGYRVLAAQDGYAAIEIARTHAGPVHLVLTDVILPGINGRQLAEALRAARPGVRVLHTSGYTADLIAHRGVLDDGIEFLAKPYSLDVLARRVRQVLDTARSPEA